MSWEAGILAILGIALLGGVYWYERTRPPSQVVALVAALAALAAAGRIALSPIPNVVPTTDITLIAGFALGGAPGFAVGALAALASNFWLGQGPWTPWQMAGWGLTGMLGAGLALVTKRQVGRLGLACVCAFAGLAYGALLDLSLMITYGGEQSLDRYLALSARGIPFNIAHAAGNFVFALVAGPALARMLLRYRRRFEFAWEGRARSATGVAAGTACLIAAVAIAAPAAQPTEAGASGKGASGAASWLRSVQDGDGGYAADPGEDPSAAMTGWAVLALEARGSHPSRISHDGTSALTYLRENAGDIATTGDMERTILVLEAAGLDAAHFNGQNLVQRLLRRRAGSGSWGGQVNTTAFGILALDAARRRSGNSRSAGWLRAAANADGGWGFAPGASSDPDSTGAALQALAAARGSSAVMRGGVRYLRSAQRSGGGFAISGGQVNAQSTAWAVQGLVAAGVAPGTVRAGGRTPLDYLASLQASDGHYRYSSSTDQTPVWVTAQALMAVTRAPFPLPRVSVGTASAAGSGGSSGGGGSSGAVSPGNPGSSSSAGGKAVGAGSGAAAAGGDAAVAGAVAGGEDAGATTGAEAERASSGGSSTGRSGGGASTGLIVGIVGCIAIALGGAAVLGRQRRTAGQ